MNGIIFGFSTQKKFNLVSWLIQKIERAKYSHVYIRVYSEQAERWLVYHASRERMNFMNFDQFRDQNNIICEYLVQGNEEQNRKVLQFSVDSVALPYGRRSLLGIGLSRVVKSWFKKSIPNLLHAGQNTLVCTELAGHCLNLLGGSIKMEELELMGLNDIHNHIAKFPTALTIQVT